MKAITKTSEITRYNHKWYFGTIYFIFSLPVWFIEKTITQEEVYKLLND